MGSALCFLSQMTSLFSLPPLPHNGMVLPF